MTSLSERGYGIDKTTLSPNELDALRSELTVTPIVTTVVANTRPVNIQLYMESSKKIYVPKCYGLKKYGTPTEVKYSPTTNITVPFVGTLRPEQQGPVDDFLQAAKQPLQTGGIINLQCAGGKTVIALYIATQLAKKTLIVVHKEFLLDQWKERIAQFVPTARVGLIKAKVIDVHDKDIVIASLQSLSMKEYDPSTFHGFGFLIVDEVHRTGTEIFSQALKKINLPFTLGLSATVTRKDGMSKVFKWYIGDVVYKGKKHKHQVEVEIHKYKSNDSTYNREETLGFRKLNFSKMITNICSYQPRTDFIAHKIVEYMHDPRATIKRRKILVLSERKMHLTAIKHAVEALDKSITLGMYVGGMKQADMNESVKKDVLLTTTALCSEGLDIQDLDTLVIATPKSEIEQICGRIVRTKDSLNIPRILDVVDMFSIYEKQGEKRLLFYKRSGFTIIGKDNVPDKSVQCMLLDEE